MSAETIPPCYCGARDYTLIRHPDFIEANCNKCRRGQDIGWAASRYSTHRCPHCGVVCPDPDVEAWLTEHRPVCTVKPT